MAVTLDELDRLYRALPPRPTDTAQINSLNVRPGPSQREERTVIELDPVRGAIGDRWERKTWLYLPNGKPDPRVQVAVCNSRVLAMLQQTTGVHHHPGDTVFTDLDLGTNNLPVGTLLRMGPALLEVSDVENDACAKFAAYYGAVVLAWIRLPQNRALRLRGLFAKVVSGGVVSLSDTIAKVSLPTKAVF